MVIKIRKIEVISEILESYDGRDKLLKLFTYSAKLATLFTKSPKTSEKFSQFGSKMSECRVILRLMSDVPILQGTIAYGWGRQETKGFVRLMKVLENIIDLIASPVEHICWMGEQKFILADERFWDHLSTWLWNTNLALALLISMVKLMEMKPETRHESFVNPQNLPGTGTNPVEADSKGWNNQFLTCLRLGLDLVYAMNSLPSGPPWRVPLKSWQGGLLGTLSASIGIYQLYKKIYIAADSCNG
ncbi:peroxisomal membrane protein 11C [Venturia canescens]|uniref:peroxisomal membrane protein 11C n=1 Tax=Venturia canescens TaxID=32260 RepID=UPI001C9C4542|nr:peroxisomal membrane protein 11C [Venturia canescens]